LAEWKPTSTAHRDEVLALAAEQQAADDYRESGERKGGMRSLHIGAGPSADATLVTVQALPPKAPPSPKAPETGLTLDEWRASPIQTLPPKFETAHDDFHKRRQREERYLAEAAPMGYQRRAPLSEEQIRTSELVDELPAKQHDAIVAVYYGEMTEYQAAKLLGVSRSTIHSNCRDALRTLKRRLVAEGYGGSDRVKFRHLHLVK
jgi:RNA polymerase sigma factor (sigma-70 family)